MAETPEHGRSAPAPRVAPRPAIGRRWRVWRRRLKRFVVHYVLHADDPPRKIALGVAIGVFVAFTPTVGFQMLLVVFLAWLLRANKVLGLPIVWISNPATLVPIFYCCYEVGRFLLGGEPIDDQWWLELTHPDALGWTRASFYWRKFTDIAAPLWLGSLVVAFLLGYVSYYLVLIGVSSYRMRKWGRLTPPDAY